MITLAIDIGGTKFSMCIFDGDRMVRRHSGATDRAGGRDWMLHQIQETGQAWQREFTLARCGIGFGGPVLFDRQQVALSTHVGGWSEFCQCFHIDQTDLRSLCRLLQLIEKFVNFLKLLFDLKSFRDFHLFPACKSILANQVVNVVLVANRFHNVQHL